MLLVLPGAAKFLLAGDPGYWQYKCKYESAGGGTACDYNCVPAQLDPCAFAPAQIYIGTTLFTLVSRDGEEPCSCQAWVPPTP